MQDLTYRQQIIQDKRKQTPRRQFVMEIASWQGISYYKNNSIVSRFPTTDRSSFVVSMKEYEGNEATVEYKDDFFASFVDLFRKSRLPGLMHFQNSENSDYGDTIVGSKNAYLSNTVTFGGENVCYSFIVRDNCVNIFNSHNVNNHCENVYQSEGITHSSYIFYSKYIIDSNYIYLSSNLIGCEYCIQCDNLEHKQYCIKNKQVSKEEFEKYLVAFPKLDFEKEYNKILVNGGFRNVSNTKGSFLENIHECGYAIGCHNISHGNNVAYSGTTDPSEYFFDVFSCGRSTHFYGVLNSGGFSEHLYCSINIGRGSHIYYSYFLNNCSYCLGCVGLDNKHFCIFNIQYSKEEWYQKVDEIFSQMHEDGTLGEFFPANTNPFYFNDSAAYLLDQTFTKEEVTNSGFLRRDEPVKVDIPADAEIIKYSELDEFESFDAMGNWLISAEVLKKVIQDEQGNYYRIIPMEYKFLMKYALPLPRKHRLERMKENFRVK